MHHIAAKGESDGLADAKARIGGALHAHGLHDDDGIPAAGLQVQVHRAAHHLADIHGAVDHLFALARQHNVLRTDAQNDASGLDILFGKARLLFIAEDDMGVLQLNGILAIGIALQLGVKGIHARHTDEACHKHMQSAR